MQKTTQALKKQLIKFKRKLVQQDITKQLNNIKKVLVEKPLINNIVQGFSQIVIGIKKI